MKTKVLVTGGAGFLGSHLCEKLLNNNYDVLCIDNYSTGSKDNIAELLKDPFFEATRHEVTLPFYTEVDQIYNLACPASPIHYQKDPSQTTKTCVHGAINMLGLAKRTNARILRLQLLKFMVILRFIHKQKIIGVASIQLALGVVMMKESVVLRRYFSIITANII